MKIKKSLTIATDIETSAVTIAFDDENGKHQTIHVPPQAADLLVLGLLSSPPKHRSDGKTSVQRFLNTLGSETAADSQSNIRLSFRVAENAFVHLALPKEAIPILQTQLARLLAGPPPKVH